MTTEIPSELKSFLNGKVCEVLIAECNDLALCDKTGELILASVGQSAELDAGHFRTDGRGEVNDRGAFWQKVLEAEICVLSMLVMLERCQRGVFLLWVPGWEIVLVLIEGPASASSANIDAG